LNIDEKLDESIYHGMQSVWKVLERTILQDIDEGIQVVVPKPWKNIGDRIIPRMI